MRAWQNFRPPPRSSVLLLCAFVVALGLGACGDGQVVDGAATPQGLIDGMAAAQQGKDFAGFVPYLLPEQRAVLSFTVGVVPLTFLTGMAEAMLPVASAVNTKEAGIAKAKLDAVKGAQATLFKKFKIGDLDMSKIMGVAKDDAALTRFAGEELGHVDHAAFLRAVVPVLAQHTNNQSVSKIPFDHLDLSKVTIKADGDTASGSIPGCDRDLRLVRRSGRWYADLMSMKK